MAAIWRGQGLRIGVFKPVESGCADGRPADAHALLNAAQSGQDLNEVCPYRLKEPLAPALAAKREGIQIDFDALTAQIEKLNAQFEILVVEGAGGILAPLTDQVDYLDLAVSTRASALIVAGNRLGVINHTLLTERALLAADVQVTGIILNDFLGTKTPAELSNHQVLEQTAHSQVLGVWPHRPQASPEDADHRERTLAAAVLAALRPGESI